MKPGNELPSEIDFQVDTEKRAKLEAQHLKVQEEIAKLPKEQQEVVKEQQRLVQIALDEQNDFHFNESMFKLDEFFITHGLPGGSENRINFIDDFQKTTKGNTFTAITNMGTHKAFYKTNLEELMAADDYIYTLEASVISTNKESEKYKDLRKLHCKLQSKIEDYTFPHFFDRLKLAFKILFNKL